MNKKIIISLSVIAAVAAVVIGGTMSYFSDTEQSTGNTFTAGSIDLKVSSHFTSATSNANGSGDIGATDLNNQALFHFSDLKPGDTGGGNFDIIATSNPYWSCMKATVDTKPENGVLEPETAAGDGSGNGSQEGELQNYLSFYLWNDLNGDGQYTVGNSELDRNLYGPLTLTQLEAAGYLPLADTTGASYFGNTALLPNVSKNLGYKYCFGAWGANPATAGLSCSGAGDQNIAQTDGVSGTIEFYAVQSRNNTGFKCSDVTNGGVQGTKVGANFSGYTHPTCNVTVTGSDIQAAIDNTATTSGETVCVGDGTYAQNVDVNKSIILASVNGSSVTTINGRVRVSATGVTVKGFDITGANFSTEAGSSGIYVVGGSNNVTISDNMIDGTTQVAAQNRGIHFEAGATTGATITNNVIKKWLQTGLFFNPTVGSITVTYNDFQTNNVGIGSDSLSNATVNNNEFNGNIVEAFGLGTPGAGNVAHQNNFIPASAGNDVNWYTSGSTVDATNNWWASEADGSRTNNTTNVTVTSPAGSAFAHN